MTELIQTVQLQEVGDSLIDLFEITLPSGTIFYAMSGMESPGATPTEDDNIYFPPKDGSTPNEYVAIPIQIQGLEVSSSGTQSRPTLSLANIPVLSKAITANADGVDDEEVLYNILEDEGITRNIDLVGSKVVHRKTLFKYTYRFTDVAGWTTTVPTEFPSTVWYIDRVAGENNVVVSFELANPLDIEGAKVPARQVIGRYCPWTYQGLELNGVGGCSWSVDSNGRFFDGDDEIITKTISSVTEYSSAGTYNLDDVVKTTESTTTVLGVTKDYIRIWKAIRAVPVNKDPKKQPTYWVRIDGCGKLINSCKIRFQGNNTSTGLDTRTPLPFGGFPGSRSFR